MVSGVGQQFGELLLELFLFVLHLFYPLFLPFHDSISSYIFFNLSIAFSALKSYYKSKRKPHSSGKENPYETIFSGCEKQFLLSAAVSIILGIVLIVYPVKTSLLICYIAGALLLFGGVVALIRYIASRGEPFFFRYDLFVALVLILFGCFVIFESDLVIAFIPVVIGIILLANGLLSIQKRSTSKKQGWKMVA